MAAKVAEAEVEVTAVEGELAAMAAMQARNNDGNEEEASRIEAPDFWCSRFLIYELSRRQSKRRGLHTKLK